MDFFESITLPTVDKFREIILLSSLPQFFSFHKTIALRKFLMFLTLNFLNGYHSTLTGPMTITGWFIEFSLLTDD